MPKKTQAGRQAPADEITELKRRLEEKDELLRAIRHYMVDAFVVTHSKSPKVVTLSEAEIPYRLMVESMNAGAVTVIPDGTIFYCNSHFGVMLGTDSENLVGVRFHDLVRPQERTTFEAIFSQAQGRGEFCLQHSGGTSVPVQLSVYQLAAGDAGGVAIIATDVTELVQAEEKIRTLASQLTMAEQEERNRISQILHDDLQQRLFAIKTQLTFLTSDSEKKGTSPAVKNNVKEVQRWLSDAIGVTRSLSIDLSPAILQGEGLPEATLWLTSQMKEQHGLQVQIESKNGLEHVDPQMRLLLFQTIRELLFNIIKHSGTSQATISMEGIDGKARITISDSGKGFNVEAVMSDPKSAHGLLIIQDRLSLMGGSIEITSEHGNGTRVVIESPVEGYSA